MRTISRADRPTIGILLEQTLGHVSHGRNLRRTLSEATDASVICRELPFERRSPADSMPPLSNWTIRSSLAARAAVREMEKDRRLDALFVHTHVPATLLRSTMERLPTVVSIDATPRQIDLLGASYQHPVRSLPVENAKWWMHAGCFRRATSLVAWSRWAAGSLVADYGVDADRIEVIPPGVVQSDWRRPEQRQASSTVRVLFVGGDFERKGGHLLIEAVERLRRDPDVLCAGIELELHLVTTADVEPAEGRCVHGQLVPNSPELIALFHRCDIFALPTKGDCTPVVLAEAASAGLPTVATDVGAVSESVIDGMTGRLVEATAASIAEGLRRMIVEPTYRLKLGEAAARHAAEQMDSERNARRLLDGLVASAHACQPASRVVLTVSGTVAPDTEDAIATGARPLADYTAIARSTGASLLDWSRLRAESSRSTRIVRRLGGDNLAVAHHLYRQRKALDVVLTDGEQVGLPLAAMLRLGGRGSLRHVMIAHRISARKKQLPIRLLGLDRCVDHVLVYASRQRQVARQLFRRPGQRVQLIDFMVDSKFFKAQRPLEMRTETRRPVLCAAGREFRDYPTLIEAVCDLDVDLVIASGSPWSKRSDNAHQVDLPPNVVVTSYTQRGLRDQLDRSDMLVLPLQANDFQAGITTILEAMSMERPVVCTATLGQTDVVVDGVNGLYVPPGDVEAMRQAIQRLIDDPDDAAAMGKRGRELVEVRGDVRRYAEIFARIVATQLER